MNMDKAKHTGEELLGKAKQAGDDIKDAFSGDDTK